MIQRIEKINGAALILVLWAICLSLNITKAFHIDDTFHLEAAQWIANNPLTPLSGKILWANNPEPMYTFNQPVLYFYIVALAGQIMGWNEIPLHIIQSIFTLLCLIYFYKISNRFYPNSKNLLLVLFCFTPGFISGQNLMVDTSLLAWLLLCFYYLLRSTEKNLMDDGIAMFFFSLAILTKYTAIALFPVFLLYFIWSKKYLNILTLGIPILFLSLWSLWNYWEFSGIHIIGRETNPINYESIELKWKSFLLTFGGMMPFSWILLFAFPKKNRKYVVMVLLAYLTYLGIDGIRIYLGQINPSNLEKNQYTYWMYGTFLILVLCYWAWIQAGNSLKKLLFFRIEKSKIHSDVFILWFTSIVVFIILFAPFLAIRHLLLVMPPVLWLLAKYLNKIPTFIIACGLMGQIFISSCISYIDWEYADFFRRSPEWIMHSIPKNKRVWSFGHWGWKWYSLQNGMSMIETNTSRIQKGDILAIPNYYSRQEIPEGIILSERFFIRQPDSKVNFIMIGHWPKLYASTCPDLPWRFGKNLREEIHLFYVREVMAEK